MLELVFFLDFAVEVVVVAAREVVFLVVDAVCVTAGVAGGFEAAGLTDALAVRFGSFFFAVTLRGFSWLRKPGLSGSGTPWTAQ